MDAKKLLVYLSCKYKGDWDCIYHAIEVREEVNNTDVEETVEKVKSHYLTILDETYPDYLKHIYHPPFVLYYYGDISLLSSNENNIVVVGSRENTGYGKKMVETAVPLLAKNHVIVSGLAKGIDRLAHEETLKAGGKTIAVLGSGIDCCYPKDNLTLYEEIKTHHLLLSEYPGDTGPDKNHFPLRNRIVASLGKGIVIIESKMHSGTSITAAMGAEQGKDVMCFPNRADEESGCNYLIKNGAILVENAGDILYQLYGKND